MEYFNCFSTKAYVVDSLSTQTTLFNWWIKNHHKFTLKKFASLDLHIWYFVKNLTFNSLPTGVVC